MGVLHLSSDRPILSQSADDLQRSKLADVIAKEIAAAPLDGGFVLSITGPWGAGKTSLMNLVVERLRASANPPSVVQFNPWLFSGSEQLVHQFFAKLSEELREPRNPASPLTKAADKLAE